MPGIATVISTSFDKLKRLSVKILYRGRITNGVGDVRTPNEVSSYGIDSNPVEGKKALYMKTGVDGKYYIVGYLNTNRLAQPGENRSFSTDANGQFKFNIWLTADGKALVGDSDNPDDYTNFAVFFNEFKEEFNKLKDDYNDLVSKVNANASLLGTHTHPYVNGSTPAVTSPSGVAGQTGSVNTSNIDNAKNPNVKYN